MGLMSGFCRRRCSIPEIRSSRRFSTPSWASNKERRLSLRECSRDLIRFWAVSLSSRLREAKALRRASLMEMSMSLISRSRPSLRSSDQLSNFSASASKNRAFFSEDSRWIAYWRAFNKAAKAAGGSETGVLPSLAETPRRRTPNSGSMAEPVYAFRVRAIGSAGAGAWSDESAQQVI